MSAKYSITGKIVSVGTLGAMLIVASWMIATVVAARQESWNQIRAGLVASWAEPQDVVGPMLRVPVKIDRTDSKGRAYVQSTTAWFLPEKLTVDATAGTELLRHGICKTSVYSTDMRISGVFPETIAATLAENAMRPEWDKAKLVLGVSDLRGIKSSLVVEWGAQKLSLEPGGENQGLKGGVLEAQLGQAPTGAVPFAAVLKVRGSQQLGFIPLGKTTEVAVRSAWKSPEFIGPFSPDSKEVGVEGFRAAWRIQHINRNIPQHWIGDARDLSASRFGVDFAVPVDYYRATTRAIQYATMFIFLTLTAFFFVEFFLKQRLHPLQYLLVGAGIVLFYLLLLSLAEHLAFPLAYGLAAAAIVGVIASYTQWIFRRAKVTGMVASVLTVLYAFFYTLLQMEEYSLLLGTAGLLLALVLIMYLTRNIDWYGIEGATES